MTCPLCAKPCDGSTGPCLRLHCSGGCGEVFTHSGCLNKYLDRPGVRDVSSPKHGPSLKFACVVGRGKLQLPLCSGGIYKLEPLRSDVKLQPQAAPVQWASQHPGAVTHARAQQPQQHQHQHPPHSNLGNRKTHIYQRKVELPPPATRAADLSAPTPQPDFIPGAEFVGQPVRLRQQHASHKRRQQAPGTAATAKRELQPSRSSDSLSSFELPQHAKQPVGYISALEEYNKRLGLDVGDDEFEQWEDESPPVSPLVKASQPCYDGDIISDRGTVQAVCAQGFERVNDAQQHQLYDEAWYAKFNMAKAVALATGKPRADGTYQLQVDGKSYIYNPAEEAQLLMGGAASPQFAAGHGNRFMCTHMDSVTPSACQANAWAAPSKQACCSPEEDELSEYLALLMIPAN